MLVAVVSTTVAVGVVTGVAVALVVGVTTGVEVPVDVPVDDADVVAVLVSVTNCAMFSSSVILTCWTPKGISKYCR